MEKSNERIQLGMVHRAVALGLALATTSLIATTTAVVFTGSTQSVGSSLARVALAPLKAVLGL